MPLPKEDIERIENKAKGFFPTPKRGEEQSDINYTIACLNVEGFRDCFIMGATAEAEKANELVEQKDKEINEILRTTGNAQDSFIKEIERLKSLIEYKYRETKEYFYRSVGATDFQNGLEEDWQQFKTENNL